jgi:hypothetical protein
MERACSVSWSEPSKGVAVGYEELTNEIVWRLTSGDGGDVCQLRVAEEASDDLR